MPLVEGLLGFDTELAGSQAWLEAANVVQGGIEGCQVVATCWYEETDIIIPIFINNLKHSVSLEK